MMSDLTTKRLKSSYNVHRVPRSPDHLGSCARRAVSVSQIANHQDLGPLLVSQYSMTGRIFCAIVQCLRVLCFPNIPSSPFDTHPAGMEVSRRAYIDEPMPTWGRARRARGTHVLTLHLCFSRGKRTDEMFPFQRAVNLRRPRSSVLGIVSSLGRWPACYPSIGHLVL
jgi:hypothetical protein